MNILQVLQTLRDDLKTWTLNVFNAYDAKVHILTEDKMDKNDPQGTGSFSLNRKANTAIGVNSSAIGNGCVASGKNSHAEGYQAQATGENSHAEGWWTKATGFGSHAEGTTAHASGDRSHAEGSSTKAGGTDSHAEGWATEANGSVSHAEGHTTIANGYASHAEGYGTIANGAYSHVQGLNNIEDLEKKYLHIVGNGNVESETRSNAHTLDWDGNAWFAGDVYAGGENVKDPLTKLVTLAEIPHEIPGMITGSIDVNNPIAEDWDMDANYLKFLELEEIENKTLFTNFNIIFHFPSDVIITPENYEIKLSEADDNGNQWFHVFSKEDNSAVIPIGRIIRSTITRVIKKDHTMVLTPGFWAVDYVAQCTFNLIEYTEPGMVITRLDEKFLPEGMMLVPVPSAANEGNILQVVNGQPTWVSIPSAESSTF